MIEGVDYSVLPLVPSELGLLLDSWRKSPRESKPMSDADYGVWFEAMSSAVLARYPLLLTARSPEGVAFGVLCAEGSERGIIVHWLFVKSVRRHEGIARALVKSALHELGSLSGPGRFYSALTFAEPTAIAWGFEHVGAWP